MGSAFAELLQHCPLLTSVDSYCRDLHTPDLLSGWSLEKIQERFGHFKFCCCTQDGVGMIMHRIQFNAFKQDDQGTREGGTFEKELPGPAPEKERDEEGHREREARIVAAIEKRIESDDFSDEFKDQVLILRLLNDNLSLW